MVAGLCGPLRATSTGCSFHLHVTLCAFLLLGPITRNLFPIVCSAWLFDVWVLKSGLYPHSFNTDLLRISDVQSMEAGAGETGHIRQKVVLPRRRGPVEWSADRDQGSLRRDDFK